jgi:hypothetical protein
MVIEDYSLRTLDVIDIQSQIFDLLALYAGVIFRQITYYTLQTNGTFNSGIVLLTVAIVIQMHALAVKLWSIKFYYLYV